ncbi:MAG: FliM/FliN family flagellar motor switch protein [Myxococcota bacterium]
MEDVRDHESSDPRPAGANSMPPDPMPMRPEPRQQDVDSMRPPSPEVPVMDDYDDAPAALEDPGLGRVLEIPLTIHVELGRKRVKIRELMQVGAGTVLTLDAQAGAALSIYANQTLIAEGEAVVVGERYGVRVTDIVSPAERVRRLGGEG